MLIKKVKKYTAYTALILTLVSSCIPAAAKSKKIKLVCDSKRITVGDTAKITLKNYKGKVKWGVPSKDVKITKKTKSSITLKALKKGWVILRAKTNKERYFYAFDIEESFYEDKSASMTLNGIYCKATYSDKKKQLKLHFINNSDTSVALQRTWTDNMTVTLQTDQMKKAYIINEFDQKDFMNFSELPPDMDSTIIVKTSKVKGDIESVKINGILYLDENGLPQHDSKGVCVKDEMEIEFE